MDTSLLEEHCRRDAVRYRFMELGPEEREELRAEVRALHEAGAEPEEIKQALKERLFPEKQE